MADSRKRQSIIRAAALAGAAMLAGAPPIRAALAQGSATRKPGTTIQGAGDWPARPVQVIVNYPAGGATDSIGRVFAQYAHEATGQSFVVENRPGASGVSGLQAVANAEPDGYTMCCTTSTPVNQMRSLLKKLPYNPDKDFAFLGAVDVGALQLLVHKGVPANNLKELVELARSRPMNLGTYGPGSFNHMFAQQLNKLYGTKLEAIHYKGESPMWADVASGQIETGIGTFGSYKTFLDRGDIKPLGLGGAVKLPNLPDMPLFKDQGFTADLFQASTGWVGFLAPAATPEPIQQRLSQLVIESLQSPQGTQTREIRGFFGPLMDRKAHTTWQHDVAPKWIAYARELGFTLD